MASPRRKRALPPRATRILMERAPQSAKSTPSPCVDFQSAIHGLNQLHPSKRATNIAPVDSTALEWKYTAGPVSRGAVTATARRPLPLSFPGGKHEKVSVLSRPRSPDGL